jgi:hypothetical protein
MYRGLITLKEIPELLIQVRTHKIAFLADFETG